MVFLRFLFFIPFISFAQNIHVTYYHASYKIATLYEELYIKEKEVLSVQDSIIHYNNLGSDEISVIDKGSKSINKSYFISKINNNYERIFLFNEAYRGNNYLIEDKVIKPSWNITTEKKIIAGFSCVKATANFRGTNVTAYFAENLKVSAGPFKFFGLPGLILEVKEDGRSYPAWKADKVVIDNSKITKINMNPSFENNKKLLMKDFIQYQEGMLKKQNEQFLIQMKKEGINVSGTGFSNRLGIEKIFEWEL